MFARLKDNDKNRDKDKDKYKDSLVGTFSSDRTLVTKRRFFPLNCRPGIVDYLHCLREGAFSIVRHFHMLFVL